MKRLAIVLLVACGSSTTPKTEIPPPNPIVLPTDEDARACRHLGDLGCPEAHACLETMSQARTERVTIPSSCLAGAKDVAAVRMCGDASTLTFTCKK